MRYNTNNVQIPTRRFLDYILKTLVTSRNNEYFKLGVYNQDKIAKKKKMINIQLVRFILLSNKEVNLILYAKQYFCSLKINVFYSWSHLIYKDKIYINLRT